MPVSLLDAENDEGDGPVERAGTGESGLDKQVQSAPKAPASDPTKGEMEAPQEEEEEVQRQRILNAPEAPTKKEVAVHREIGRAHV